MKKHQLLEKAMRDYPAGTICTWGGEPIISTGIFHFNDEYILDSNELSVYDGKEWATIIPESILSGKCAIAVNNEREFKLLMEHYESKGWKSFCDNKPSTLINENAYTKGYSFRYENEFGQANPSYHQNKGYKIIQFADFSNEVGIKVPVFVMTSEDGVDMYIGDDYCRACLIEGIWELSSGISHFTNHDLNLKPAFKSTWFSSREAAEAWIKEQNKPKSTSVYLYFGGSAEVYSDHIYLHGGIKMAPSDLEDILHAYKSL